MSSQTRIRQIVPAAPGWNAAYAIEHDDRSSWEPAPIPLWLLVEEWLCPLAFCPATIGQACPEEEVHDGFATSVVPAAREEKYLYPAVEDSNFLCILDPDDALAGGNADEALARYERRRARKERAK
jgi:hypothetical protein